MKRVLAEVLLCVRFYSRLPIPALPFEAAVGGGVPFGPSLRFAPLAGAAIGAIGAIVLAIGAWLGLPNTPAAGLAVLSMVMASGGLHEDGLADLADAFGGGSTPERKLAVMRDSRIGSYGALAIGFSLILRISALAAMAERWGTGGGATMLLAAAATSRAAGLLPFAVLPPARTDGLAFGARGADRSTVGVALGLSALLDAAATRVGGLAASGMCLAFALSCAGSLIVAEIARRQIGGHTGDVFGAAQQIAEINCLLGVLFASPVG